ncbi:leucine-rich repeat protein SHOC-2-like [Littorina saxatilis]|uniref:leucine-rich repeat protein SHOC-2-like n=1 Tax=Littorina saxatilis TaxID=31220 RepID=UPI0038B5B72E
MGSTQKQDFTVSDEMKKREAEKMPDPLSHDTHIETSEQTLDLSSQSLQDLGATQLSEIQHAACLTTLNLDFNDLASLPDGIFKCLLQLQVFSANGNNFKTLPEEFGSLTSLMEVHLCENELMSLPDSVAYLVNVKCLRLTGNQLSCLPEDFGELASLEELSVEENQLTKFPPTFALLDKLRILEASHNKLSVLPKFLGSLKSLTHLNVSSNIVEKIPDSFSDLERLVCVDISDNKLRTLPLTCSSQRTLKKFYGGMNMLTGFPFWVGRLPELTDLCLKENNITGNCLPDDIGQVCKKLRYLDLCGNHLTELPESFGELESLEFVHFGSMLDELERKDYINGNWLRQLPRSFPQLTALTKLRLDENHLQFLPDDIGRLCNLEYLNLGQNILHDVPESFGELQSLRVCILSRNNIQLLPSSIGQLSALEEFYIDNNMLAELPESLSDLKQLKMLDLFHNKLTTLPTCLHHLTNLKYLDLNQNPLKIPKKLVPSIKMNIKYEPRSQDPNSKWRGRMRERTADFVNLEVVSGCEGEDDGDEFADEPVDELYSPEDIPYNMRFLRSPDIKSITAWRTHSGPEIRPLFVRQAHRVQPRPLSPPDDWEERYDNSSGAQSEGDHDGSDGDGSETGAEESWDTESGEEHQASEDLPTAPLPEDESWDNWEDTPALPYNPVQGEENWEEELADNTAPYSHEDVCRPHSTPFLYNPMITGFFMGPFDLHAPRTFRPKVDDPDYKPPSPVDGQFCDDAEEEEEES